MFWTPKQRRIALILVPTALAATAALGLSLGKAAFGSSRSTPYSLSSTVPYYANGNGLFMLSIQNSLYNSSSLVKYAQVFGPSGSSLGYWAVANQQFDTVPTASGPVNVMTVQFNTTLLVNPPGHLSTPGKVLPAKPVSISTGSTLCVTTNVGGDSCPTSTPITLNLTNINPCP